MINRRQNVLPELQRRKERAALLSVVSNSSLVVVKLLIGLLVNSVAIVAEAIHSGIDLLAALIALFSVKTASLPADRRHPYGHGKIENISGTIEALLIFVAAGWIIYAAAVKLLHPAPIANPGWGAGVMLLSMGVNIFVSRMLFRVGRETESIALQADAWHLRTDVYTSAGVMGSLVVIWAAGRLAPQLKLGWLDPFTALIVALLIVKAAYELTLRSGQDLIDTMLPAEEEAWIRASIARHKPAVHGFHNMRTRKAGQFRFVECHLKMDPWMSVAAAHQITDEITAEITARIPGTTLTLHIEPCDGVCAGQCLEGCLLTESQRQQRLQQGHTLH